MTTNDRHEDSPEEFFRDFLDPGVLRQILSKIEYFFNHKADLNHMISLDRAQQDVKLYLKE